MARGAAWSRLGLACRKVASRAAAVCGRKGTTLPEAKEVISRDTDDTTAPRGSGECSSADSSGCQVNTDSESL